MFLKIIDGRIKKQFEEGIEDSQFRCKNDFGTRKALFANGELAQRYVDVNADIHVCYIELKRFRLSEREKISTNSIN